MAAVGHWVLASSRSVRSGQELIHTAGWAAVPGEMRDIATANYYFLEDCRCTTRWEADSIQTICISPFRSGVNGHTLKSP